MVRGRAGGGTACLQTMGLQLQNHRLGTVCTNKNGKQFKLPFVAQLLHVDIFVPTQNEVVDLYGALWRTLGVSEHLQVDRAIKFEGSGLQQEFEER